MTNYLHITSPLDQFEIRNLLSLDAPILGNLSLSLTNIGLYLTIAGYLTMGFSLLAVIICLMEDSNLRIGVDTTTTEKGKENNRGRVEVCFGLINQNITYLTQDNMQTTSATKNFVYNPLDPSGASLTNMIVGISSHHFGTMMVNGIPTNGIVCPGLRHATPGWRRLPINHVWWHNQTIHNDVTSLGIRVSPNTNYDLIIGGSGARITTLSPAQLPTTGQSQN